MVSLEKELVKALNRNAKLDKLNQILKAHVYELQYELTQWMQGRRQVK